MTLTRLLTVIVLAYALAAVYLALLLPLLVAGRGWPKRRDAARWCGWGAVMVVMLAWGARLVAG